ncbi:diiron oxygenase (plasmid) [Tistrella bauzanensis]|uniref:diiron oxygenase n=1 Tax=Tistrella TaxID=171436 RepID=UPI0031F638F5
MLNTSTSSALPPGVLAQPAFARAIDRLSKLSVDGYYNPYRSFAWPDAIDPASWWMPPELLSVWGTDAADTLDEATLRTLAKWESINFYSLNVHGIRELLQAVIARLHEPGYEVASRFFHHFVGEENDHMWFFAEFCLRYAGKLYPDRQVRIETAPDPLIENFLVFARITIFEEIVDFYNTAMGADERLDPAIRKINQVHHVDESRHIAFGRKLMVLLHEDLCRRGDEALLDRVSDYLRRYMTASIRGFYSPDAYRDAGIAEPLALRRGLLSHPARAAFDARVLRRTTDFMTATGILRPVREAA